MGMAVGCVLCGVLLITACAADGAVVVKLHHTKRVGDTVAHIQRVRAEEMADTPDAADVNTTDAVSLLEIPSGTGELKKKKFGFKAMEYFVKVKIDGKAFNMLFDTATPHTWVPAQSCTTCCPSDSYIPPKQSPLSTPLFEKFPDGTWFSGVSQTGDLVIGADDDVSGANDELRIPAFGFFQIFVKGRHTPAVPEHAPQGTEDPSEDCSDSVIGLSFSTSPEDVPLRPPVGHQEVAAHQSRLTSGLSFIDRLFREHIMTAPVIAFHLTTDEDTSLVEFGSIDRALVKRSLNPNGLFYVPAVGFPDFVWAFNVPRVCVNAQCFRVGTVPAHISSAVPYIALPKDVYQAFRKPQDRVPDPCQILPFLPTLALIAVGSDENNPANRYPKRFELCPADYSLVSEDGKCDFAVVPTKGDSIVLGTPFLRKFMTVLDVEEKQMGFAQVTDLCRPKEEVKMGPKEVMELLMAVGQGANPEELMAAMAKRQAGAKAEEEEGEPPLLKDNEYLTYHKRILP